MEQINTEKFDELLKGDKPVVCDFFATWCGPCRKLSPLVDEIAQAYDGKVKFAKVNVEESIETAKKYSISGLPSLLIFKNR